MNNSVNPTIRATPFSSFDEKAEERAEVGAGGGSRSMSLPSPHHPPAPRKSMPPLIRQDTFVLDEGEDDSTR